MYYPLSLSAQRFLFFWDYKRNTSCLFTASSEPLSGKAFLGTEGCVWCMAFFKGIEGLYESFFLRMCVAFTGQGVLFYLFL